MAFVNTAAAQLFPLVPRRLARTVAARYIAGTSVEEAVSLAARLHARGLIATLDVLGESVQSESEASAFAGQYVDALAALAEAGLQPHVSVKPSALGSLLDWRLCERNVRRIAEVASACGGSVCLDMEWSHSVDETLALYRRLRDGRIDNVTMVAQARLHRTHDDLASLARYLPHVRICKGIYPEPAQIAYTDPEAIRRNYIFCLETLLQAEAFVAVATHDEALVVSALARLARDGRPRNAHEFQMLLGVRQDLAESLADAGHPVRIYLPFGGDWHQYATRRFRESPQIIGYLVRAVARGSRERLVSRLSGRTVGRDELSDDYASA